MEKLEKLVDFYVNENIGKVDNEKMKQDSKLEFVDALKETITKQIVDEVKCTCVKEITDAADVEIQTRENKEKLKQLKTLMWTGVVVAFVAGLLVNQVTELIGCAKGTVTMNSIWSTVIISIGLLGICLIIYGYSFAKDVIKMYNDIKSKKKEL